MEDAGLLDLWSQGLATEKVFWNSEGFKINFKSDAQTFNEHSWVGYIGNHKSLRGSKTYANLSYLKRLVGSLQTKMLRETVNGWTTGDFIPFPPSIIIILSANMSVS